MKIIFLDIDGVLNSVESMHRKHNLNQKVRSADRTQDTDFPCEFLVANLNQIIKDTDAKIVVSSTWRIGKSIQDLREILMVAGVHKANEIVIGKTPLMRDVIRGIEIQDWINQFQPELKSFVILDDDSDMGTLMNKLVKTNSQKGLTIENVMQAIKLLNENN